MKKIIAAALISALYFSGAAYAETTKAEVDASVKAVKKDNAAIAKQQGNIEVNREEKEAAKERGDVADQASQSVQIGANKAAIEAKKVEKKVDQKILENDRKNYNESAPAAR